MRPDKLTYPIEYDDSWLGHRTLVTIGDRVPWAVNARELKELFPRSLTIGFRNLQVVTDFGDWFTMGRLGCWKVAEGELGSAVLEPIFGFFNPSCKPGEALYARDSLDSSSGRVGSTKMKTDLIRAGFDGGLVELARYPVTLSTLGSSRYFESPEGFIFFGNGYIDPDGQTHDLNDDEDLRCAEIVAVINGEHLFVRHRRVMAPGVLCKAVGDHLVAESSAPPVGTAIGDRAITWVDEQQITILSKFGHLDLTKAITDELPNWFGDQRERHIFGPNAIEFAPHTSTHCIASHGPSGRWFLVDYRDGRLEEVPNLVGVTPLLSTSAI